MAHPFCRFPLLMIAPEGTTKFGHCLLRFSTGAFVPGQCCWTAWNAPDARCCIGLPCMSSYVKWHASNLVISILFNLEVTCLNLAQVDR